MAGALSGGTGGTGDSASRLVTVLLTLMDGAGGAGPGVCVCVPAFKFQFLCESKCATCGRGATVCYLEPQCATCGRDSESQCATWSHSVLLVVVTVCYLWSWQ